MHDSTKEHWKECVIATLRQEAARLEAGGELNEHFVRFDEMYDDDFPTGLDSALCDVDRYCSGDYERGEGTWDSNVEDHRVTYAVPVARLAKYDWDNDERYEEHETPSVYGLEWAPMVDDETIKEYVDPEPLHFSTCPLDHDAAELVRVLARVEAALAQAAHVKARLVDRLAHQKPTRELAALWTLSEELKFPIDALSGKSEAIRLAFVRWYTMHYSASE